MNYLFVIFVGLLIPSLCYNNENYNVRDKRAILKRRIFNFTMPVNYYYDFTSKCQIIEKAIAHISDYTCITFKKVKKPFDNIGIIFKQVKKDSYVEDNLEKGKSTIIYVNKDCTLRIGCIKSLLGRAFGLIPHVQRWDRDTYVEVKLDNIQDEYKKYYTKISGLDVKIMNTAFDFGSIMNYESKQHSINGKPSYKSKWNKLYNKMLGQRVDFSHNDIKLLNDLHCGKVCPKKVKGCINGGYPDPLNCGHCRCPKGYVGKLCGIAAPSDKECGKTILKASHDIKSLQIKSNIQCNYLIKADPGYKVIVYVDDAVLPNENPCTNTYGLEIKNRYDKGATGLSICGRVKDVETKPIFSQVLVRYYGRKENHYANIRYEAVTKETAREFDYVK
ncbi:Astacin-like metalloendopeptidase [Strongyloides ratti]|uniref:Metalloendopeptidase n=1 Tax=Strongyloides ratti TaxID=34506 RepID=A0A090KTV1_STRRB|nr:Astacin-like metalloendopeptidase [Strongyloides ratti]CEF60950.1 Astacin-like metalloendopeptidase [Strongyloides ratti]